MSSNYRNFRNNVPWLILFLEAVFIVLFYFLFSHGDESRSTVSYAAFQDVNYMVIFGFGFFLTFLKRYGFSSTGFNLLIVVLGVQCSVLIENLFYFLLEIPHEDGLKRITKAAVSITAVVISTGAVLGKTNPVQLILMTVVEIIVFHMSRWINRMYLQVPDDVGMMHVHLFGAYFGLAVSSCFPEPSPRSEKNASTPKSALLSMLGLNAAERRKLLLLLPFVVSDSEVVSLSVFPTRNISCSCNGCGLVCLGQSQHKGYARLTVPSPS